MLFRCIPMDCFVGGRLFLVEDVDENLDQTFLLMVSNSSENNKVIETIWRRRVREKR
jgi:hypothetical protein